MMKWGRKKPPSSSFSSRLPSLSRVLPIAWLSTFKRMSIDSEPKPATEMRNSMSASSSRYAGGGERFNGGDAEAFWRLSGEDSADGKTSRSVSQSAWYDSDDELDFAPSSCRSYGSNAMRIKEKEETKTFGNIACSRIITEKDLKLKKTNEKAMEEKSFEGQNKSGQAQQKSAKSVEKKTSELEPVRTIPIIGRENLRLTGGYQRKHQHLSTMNLRTSNLTTIKEDCAFTAQKLAETDVFSPEKFSSEADKWKEMKIGKVKVKNEEQTKSLYRSKELPRRRMKQNNKVRIFSPRTDSRVQTCKIKALEDMKKAKLKMKAAKQTTISGTNRLENFAMVKCSFDPEKDFRDSMIEMIGEKRISKPEELEELLACYLTLNSDEYHDLIIKAFQQIWFNLYQASSETDLQNEQSYFD